MLKFSSVSDWNGYGSGAISFRFLDDFLRKKLYVCIMMISNENGDFDPFFSSSASLDPKHTFEHMILPSLESLISPARGFRCWN
jgi:hypothetical protein